MTEYDEQDQAYQELMEEANACREQNGTMKELIKEICALIDYQCSLWHQDQWLVKCINLGLYTREEE